MIGVLTYDHPHRKTQDVLFLLKALGHSEVRVCGLLWEDRKPHPSLFPHRPVIALDVHPRDLARNLGYEWTEPGMPACKEELDVFLIGGAGLLQPPPEAPPVINAHPGYLPHTRGLDAMKWAILHGDPIGVTTHVINEEVDGGYLIERRELRPRFLEDFSSFARRMYETEIEMLVDAIGKEPETIPLSTQGGVHKRMKHREELMMMERYEELRRRGD